MEVLQRQEKIPYNENVGKVTTDGRKEVFVTYKPNISCTNVLHGNNHREVREYTVWGFKLSKQVVSHGIYKRHFYFSNN